MFEILFSQNRPSKILNLSPLSFLIQVDFCEQLSATNEEYNNENQDQELQISKQKAVNLIFMILEF